jgi:hypothetical protein
MNQLTRVSLGCLIAFGITGQVPTGPEVGAKIPQFELPDQDGKPRTFDNLRGPQGLVLAFVRSADW